MNSSKPSPPTVEPRIILHGGAGNITPENLPPHLQSLHRRSLLRILHSTHKLLCSTTPQRSSITALDAVCHAVRLLELDPLYNAGVGAVFTRDGTIELEASVMVSSPKSVKRGAAVSRIKHVKSPVGLAREILLRGEDVPDGGGAQGHVHLSGEYVEGLAKNWGLEMCEAAEFWTRPRWEEHRRGLKKERAECSEESYEEDRLLTSRRQDGTEWTAGDPTWDGKGYLPQGTVGCVVLDRFGTVAVATSTGGITNKLPGRVGDTPTFGCGFWAEEWLRDPEDSPHMRLQPLSPLQQMAQNATSVVQELDLLGFLKNCFSVAMQPRYDPLEIIASDHSDIAEHDEKPQAVALSGTGNGDSFLRLAAVHTAAMRLRFTSSTPQLTLPAAIQWMAGPGGKLQQSAGARWGTTGDGQGGISGIERIDGYSFNCGGMFRAYVDDDGKERWGVFKDEHVPDDEDEKR